ncbi:MAG: ABC transporter permease [Spirochaetaceae bacterium]|jgi:peptide/nickel transport system permease protein/nickel transport system permease protein|nr:ABC transporter permease [Spirochaetaceae bacterium]
MKNYMIQRLSQCVAVFFGVTVLVFFLIRIAPGDAAYIHLQDLGLDLSKERLASIREELGLNRPIPIQYLLWLRDVLRLDLGISLQTGEPVLRELILHFRRTVTLAFPVILSIPVFAFPLGILCAIYQSRFLDGFLRLFIIVMMSIPSFCLGLILILFFSVHLKWLPSFGAGTPAHRILPGLTIAIGSIAYYTRFIRGAFLEEFAKEYIRCARARGVKLSGLVRSAAKNALIPIVTSLGMSLALMLGGSAVVEKVFSYPGVGKYFIDAVMRRDYAVVQGCVLLFAFLFAGLNLASDLMCGALYPASRNGVKKINS